MKSQREIQIEALPLVQRGASMQQQIAAAGTSVITEVSTGPLLRLPDHISVSGDTRFERFIDAVLNRDEVTFRLMERRVSVADMSSPVGEQPYMLNVGNAEDVLRAGYEMTEQEALQDRMNDFDYRRRSEAWAPPESCRELEELLQIDQLRPADCIRMKADISAFIDGRIERQELILHFIGRQLTREPLHESQMQTQSLRLTINEP